MQLPLEKKNLTVQEAADVLNVRRERIWKLMTDGVLLAHPSKLDGRRKLIPREQVEQLLQEEGYRPRRTRHRARKDASVPTAESVVEDGPFPAGHGGESGDLRKAVTRSYPPSVGTVSDGPAGGTSDEQFERNHSSTDPEAVRRIPRTIGVVDDESFQASESEGYMHEHRGREHATAE